MVESRIKDSRLAPEGRKRVKWAEMHMPVLMRLKNKFIREKPFEDLRVSACLHVTKETGALVRVLKALGAEVFLAASNPLSTQDDVAAFLAEEGIHVVAKRGETSEEYFQAIESVLKANPDLTMDDGGDLTVKATEVGIKAVGGTEETTTGVIRIKALEREGKLLYPIIAVNNAETKWDFDNVHGTGQSALDGVLRATNILIAGKKVVVAGFGHVGRGIAIRTRGLGARVIVTEVDPIKALKAVMEGFDVMKMEEAAKIGDIFITATGNRDVIRGEHFRLMKDGAVLANAGHFNVEISVDDLERIKREKRLIRKNVVEYDLGGKRIYLLAEGRLVNLVAAEGHPSEVMDMSFSDQVLALKYLLDNRGELEARVYELPRDLDCMVAEMKLKSMGIEIDSLTRDQREYLRSWRV